MGQRNTHNEEVKMSTPLKVLCYVLAGAISLYVLANIAMLVLVGSIFA